MPEATHRRRKQGQVYRRNRYISYAGSDGVTKSKAEMHLRFARTSQATRRISTTTPAVKT